MARSSGKSLSIQIYEEQEQFLGDNILLVIYRTSTRVILVNKLVSWPCERWSRGSVDAELY